MTHPSLLNLGVEETLAPTLDWLQRRLGLDAAQLRKMVLASAAAGLQRRGQHGAEARLAPATP